MLAPVIKDEWKVQTEVSVDGVILFRHRKTAQSSFPVPKWVVTLRVVSSQVVP
jgi:hypothetical protein